MTLAHPASEPLSRARALLPRGGLLPEEARRVRHRWIVRVLAAHFGLILVYALARGFWPPHALLEAAIPLLAAFVAGRGTLSPRLQAVAASAGLLSASAILVHVSGGYIEMHFHFFVVMIVISLYQEWVPFLLAIAYVVVHHGLAGTIDPSSVYNHADAIANPWKWAAIHGAFIAAASVAGLASWRLAEDALLARLASERRARVAAEAGLKLREDFLSVATHELRTPVASVKGYAQLALRGLGPAADPRLRSNLETLLEQTERLSGLVTQLLDASRIEAGRLSLELVRTDLRPLVMNVVGVAQQHAGPRHRFSVEAAAGVEAVVDPARFEQVVTNLVENAVRYTPDGGDIAVRLSAGKGEVRLEVEDTGIGIPPARQKHVFERFYQAHRDLNYGGMGLGLYIAREIVQRHDGRIEVSSEPGKGTRVTVVLPLAPAAEPVAAPVPRPVLAVTPPERPPASGRVLVVEDDGDIRRLVAGVLREEGYEVLEASSGREALLVLEGAEVDLILLDKLMPVMDGTTFAREYAESGLPRAPIVGLCAARDAAEWSRSIGAAGWVPKPFDLDALVAAVATHARSGAGAATA